MTNPTNTTKPPRAAFLVTVCRRYHELEKNLPAALARAEEELGYRPEVVLVWARPEAPRLPFFHALVSGGLVTRVLGRPALEGEGAATTYPESVSIRLGLEHIRAHLACDYVVFMTADVCPAQGTLRMVDEKVREGHEAVVFRWDNSAGGPAWHTNFFACSLDEGYWPPVSPPKSCATLESQYAACLGGRARVCRSHNYRSNKFSHEHESEGLPPFAERALPALDGVPLYCAGAAAWADTLSSLFSPLASLLRGVVRVCTYPFTEQPWQSVLTKQKPG